MPGGLILVLIIVVWLFVLAPLLLRGQKPISKAGGAFDETRVLHHGGTELPRKLKRTPRFRRRDVHRFSAPTGEELEVIAGEEISRAAESAQETEAIVDGDVVCELPAAPVEVAQPHYGECGEEETTELRNYEVDDSYVSPEDLLYPDPKMHSAQPVATAEASEESATLEADLTEEELQFAASRRGRGGWDPEADAAHSSGRYQRRQRTLLGLMGLIVVTIVLSVVMGTWGWVAMALTIAMTVGYLAALRRQVRQEQQLRARRIRQLRRARLGVRHRDDEALNIPRQLRRPGAVVVELDDDSPDFFHLMQTTQEPAIAHPERTEPQPLRDRRRDRDIYGSRAVS